MKPTMHFFLLPVFCLFAIPSLAQPDSSIFKTGEDKYERSYKKYVLETEPEIRRLWKLNLVDIDVPAFNLGIETKLSKKITSESYLRIGLPAANGYYSRDMKWSLSQHIKYYYNLNRKERLGRTTNGFNANFISFDIFAGEDRDPKPGYHNQILKDAGSWFGIGIRYGMQKRVGNFFFEPYVGLGYQYYVLNETGDNVPAFNFHASGNPNRWHLQPIAGINAGIAVESLFNLPKLFTSRHPMETDSQKKQPVLFKTNMVDLRLLKPNIGCEWRIIGNLTSETFLKFGVDIKPYKFIQESGFGSEYSAEYGIDQQFRYYHNFKRRVIHGKNISNFSGNYLSLGAYAANRVLHYDLDVEDVNHHGRRAIELYHYGFGIKYGIQRQIGHIGFVDLFTGAVLQISEEPNQVSGFIISKTINEKILPVVGIRAGFGIGSGLRRDYKF